MTEKKSVRSRVQNFGSFLSSMVMPNIAAFIAWGVLTALFIPKGWIPNEKFANLVDPIIIYAIPILIAYTGGNIANPRMGGVVGAIATMGAIVGSEQKMLVAAMILGPLSAWLLKKIQDAYDGHVKSGFEMLVNNFVAGFLAFGLSLFAYVAIAPVMEGLLNILSTGVDWLVQRHLLPLVHIFVEPAKILFLNNAINHGILFPIGLDQVEKAGKSMLFMIESNPGPGFGILLAYMIAGKKNEKASALGASVIQVFGGIHEIYFPYVLMNPKLIIAAIVGGMSSTFLLQMMSGGLVSSPSPGSLISWILLTPRGSYLPTIIAFAVSTVVSMIVALPILRNAKNNGKSLDEATSDMKNTKANKTLAKRPTNTNLADTKKIIFACDAGMGSSAMGASILKKKVKEAGLDDIEVRNVAIPQIPDDADVVITHQDLTERAIQKNNAAYHVSVKNFMQAPEYDQLIADIKDARENNGPTSPQKEETINQASNNEEIETVVYSSDGEKITEDKKETNDSSVLKKENILLNQKFDSKEEVIKEVGRIMESSGYVDHEYTNGMLQRENEAPTHFGIGLAIPHGTNKTKSAIKKSGLVVLTIPEGVKWDDEIVKLVIGIAGVGDEHLAILSNVATKIDNEEIVNDIVENKSKDEIYEILTSEV
ncbi:PTS mannitol transporter subunit IICBA [Anaerococcus sp. mt242]|uniref:PTS mannitol transporter subunit IICBA n=1 Tax=Anaerococcus sp. mt242 TaxID=2661917 RepID=UPI0019348F85|nr:PTS mannitol transporter subunit IICBA [Anaerococcus sp. mt242]MBM0047105.1 PTS mannitol transporter subunit IICBA [Anaerococcus sp. mt242]